jgi:two-component system sensor histidine kinase HydH
LLYHAAYYFPSAHLYLLAAARSRSRIIIRFCVTRKEIMANSKLPAVSITVFTLLVTYLHYSSVGPGNTLHNIYRELYYIPVVLGALAYGMKGAILSYLLIFVLYFPYVLMTWPGRLLTETNRLLPLLLQGLFSFIAGYLVDREKTQRTQFEKNRSLAEIGRISTIIVHDLKNPLIAILGFAARIKEGKGKTDAAIQVIIDSAEKMQRIVHGVLDFAGPLQLNLKEADIRDIVNRVIITCGMKAEQRGVNLIIDQPSVPVITSVDSFHLERALVNLITNALEASSKGQSVDVTVAVEKNGAVIRIKDRGLGMDRETLGNMFIPFYTKKSGGTGLGMPIAKKVVDEHKGKIQVTSKPGQGTEVTIELPS